MNVTFAVSCKTGDRHLRADILDKDLFDHSAKMPANTSWTMQILNQLDGSLGLGVMDKPIFSIAPAAAQIEKPSHLAILENLKNGSYDGLFTSEKNFLNFTPNLKHP